MRAILIRHGRKSVVEFPTFGPGKIRELVEGDFDGIPLPTPDETLPPEEQSLYLYVNAIGAMRDDFAPNFRLGRRGQIVHGPAVIVGLRNDVQRDLTDLELDRIYLPLALVGTLPILQMRGHNLAAPRRIVIEEDD